MKIYIKPEIKTSSIALTKMLITSKNGHCSNCKWGDADGDGTLEEFWHCDHSAGWGGQGKFYPDCDY